MKGERLLFSFYWSTINGILFYLCSTDVDKDSREQFEIRTHKWLINVYAPSEQTMESLRNLDLSASVYKDIFSKATSHVSRFG